MEAPDAQSWDLLVPRTIPAGLDLSMPWAAEVAAVAGVVMRPETATPINEGGGGLCQRYRGAGIR
jgi:hypothetical protein